MDKARTTGKPWRSWAAIAFVLLALAVIQACDSGKHTGPTSNSSLQLKLRRVGGAELPTGCTGVYSVSGPGVNIQNAALPASGEIAFQGQVGQTYHVTVTLNCNGTILTGTADVTLQRGDNSATIQLTVSKVLGVACSPNPVDPGKDSICTCSVQSPGVPSLGWTGATPTTGNQAKFNNNNPGSYTVTCSINGVAAGSTTVTVASPQGVIKVVNTGCCDFFAKAFVQPANTQVGGELSLTDSSSTSLSVPPGNYIVRISCSSGGGLFGDQGPLAVTAGNTTIFSFPGPCG